MKNKRNVKILKGFDLSDISEYSTVDLMEEIVKNGGKCKYLKNDKCIFFSGESHDCNEIFCPLYNKLKNGV